MLQHRNFTEGRAHMHYVDLSNVHASMLCISPALNRSTVLQHFEHDNTIEIRNGVVIDFYPGLPDVTNNDLAM